MSPTSVVVAAGPVGSTPRGPAIDVFNFGGGRCRTCRQHPQGVRHPRLQHLDLQLRHLRGPAVNMFLSVDGGRSRTSSSGTSWGPAIDYRVKNLR
jgi:hypothetical protein